MPSDKPHISVIMPVYNAARFVRAAVDSIRRQTYGDFELLVGDDASTDDTLRILETYQDERIRIIRFDKNVGAVAVRNQLISMSKGRFIAFQDADDRSHLSRLELQVKELIEHPNIGMVGCQLAYLRKDGATTLRLSNHPVTYAAVLCAMYRENVFCGATLMITRAALEAVGGGYRDYFGRLSNEDYDLTLLVAEKYECYNLPDVLYYYRQHGQSASKIISVERFLAKEIVVNLATQRRVQGVDDLQDGHPEKVDALLDELKRPFKVDGSLVYRTYASNFMYNMMFMEAFSTSMRGIGREPLRMINYRTLLYCLRRILFH